MEAEINKQIRDIQVTYESAGTGPPVVFIHGLAEDHTSWAAQQRELQGFQSVAYDLRGHGGTEAGVTAGTLEQLGRDLIAFLEDVTGPAVCVGFSLGGTIVLWAAAERADVVAFPVVLGTSSVVGRSAAQFYRDRIALSESGDAEGFASALLADTQAATANSSVDVKKVTSQRLRALGDGAGYRNAAAAMAKLNEEPLTPRLQEIKQHVRILGGENDTFCPRKAADIMLEVLPDAKYLEIAGAGHLMNVDQPSAVTQAVRERLAEIHSAQVA